MTNQSQLLFGIIEQNIDYSDFHFKQSFFDCGRQGNIR